MSKKSDKVIDREKRTDTVVGVVTVAVVLALVLWLFVSMSIRGSAISEVAYEGETHRGAEQTFTAIVNTPKIKDGDAVKWIVNGEVVHEDTYTADNPPALNYVPKTAGQNMITVKIGKFSQSAYVDVLPPQLTVKAPDLTVCYGESIPQFNYECCGFIDGDSREMLDYNGECTLCDANGNELNAEKLNVGVYKLNMVQDCCFKDYQVNYIEGTLTVLPKQLSVTGNFEKVYDGTNTIENPQIALLGVEYNDSVTAKCDKLYFENKNAGYGKTIMLANVTLEGADSRNYVLESAAYGNILPKEVEISGLVISDKMYDGTTRAQIDKMGSLDGVCEGDSVAIGSIGLSFAEADAGKQQVVLDEVSLIGADKDNYFVTGVDAESATINTTIWNKIFVKNPVVGA